MSKIFIPFVVAAVFASVGCNTIMVPKEQYDNDLAQLKAYNTALERDNAEMRAKADAYDRLRQSKGLDAETAAEYAAIADALKKALAGLAIEEGDVTVGDQGQLIVQSDLLFDLGSWNLSARGKEVLKKIASTQRGGLLRIVGHTDKRPIASPKTKQSLEWDNNTELSTKRALAVQAELIKAGLSERNLWVEGHGSAEPRGNDKTSRRVEIWRVGGPVPANTSFQK